MRALRLRVLTTISALLLMVPVLAQGQTLTAVWDPNPPADAITSYEICIGTTSASCNFQLASVPSNETSYTFSPTAGVLYRLTVRATNAAGPGPFSSEVVISIPGLTQPANQTSTVNVAISPLSLSATDPDGGSLQFTHNGLPFGLSLNQSSGIISGTPDIGRLVQRDGVRVGRHGDDVAHVHVDGERRQQRPRYVGSEPGDHEPHRRSDRESGERDAGRHGDRQRSGRQRHHERHREWRSGNGRNRGRQHQRELEPERRAGGRSEHVHGRRY